MARQFSLIANAKIVELLAPAADAGGRTGAKYVSLANAHKAYVIAHITQGNAATILLSVLQATSAAGGGSKAISAAAPIWSALDTATTDALVARTAGTTYTTDAGVKNKVVVFELLPEAVLDMVNSFKYIGFSTGASNAANITQAMMYLVPIRYNQATPPTAIT